MAVTANLGQSKRSAVIYCRVSSAKQTTHGDGLASQETRCREYARYKGYQVAEVFKDDISGSLTARPCHAARLSFSGPAAPELFEGSARQGLKKVAEKLRISLSISQMLAERLRA